ncbi:flagellar basal-body MS-ring/collar protein FliF [Hydrogenophaga sp. OTU3427]|uniref:flagellar basal-body MS-ring/collar protein FliF n=1 Tax=Hydrogenophaga sp. OTU3427 TaxID=3043856 RepID=UPI00313D029F
MNTAVAEVDLRPAAPQNALLEGFTRLDNRRKFTLVGGALALLAVLMVAFYMNRQADWKVLFANLSDKDGGAVIAQLTTLNVPYKHADGGRAILVPADKVHDTRLRLASQGLPKGSITGFELMDNNRLGMTQFQERLSFQRGLEGELTRSIQALSSVADARVHLALPNQNGFFREQQKPSASVLLTLHPGRTLDRAQIAGIVHLVASSVPEMNPKAVSVLDETGALLSNPAEGQAGSVDTQQLQYVQQLEQVYVRRIMDLLEPLVGRENVRAQVTADVDFSMTEQTQEQHRPNQGTEPSAVRSQQTIEAADGNGALPPPGAPGAVSNQPPAPSTAPINGQPGAVGVTAANGATAASTGLKRREQVTNYEVDKTVRVTRGATGNVRRLSAAVVVNHRTVTDAKGNTSTEALPAAQVEQMTALVREAIGFSQDRGDSVNLMNSPFSRAKSPVSDVPWWKASDNRDLAQSLAWPVGMVLLGLVIFMGVIRPALRDMRRPSQARLASEGAGASGAAGSQLEAMLDEAPERPGLLPPTVSADAPEVLRLEDARRLAKENPVAVANIIKNWVNGESSGAVAPT